jgi:hypothetical protein
MLTLDQPISLLSASGGLPLLSNGFCERLLANYEIMAANISPKELLHLLTNPPEFPLTDGGMTSFAVENRITAKQDVLLSVVNNIINRILADEHGTLTYQDRVYIEMSLNKLGVTHTQMFINQVRALRDENVNIYRLLNLYQKQAAAIKVFPAARTLMKQIIGEEGGEKTTKEERRLYLHDTIYRRLDTAAIYREVHRHTRSAVHTQSILERNELATAEQIRVSQLLTLNELRREWMPLQGEQLMLRHNAFETGELLSAPVTEKAVISQAAAAALYQTVGNVIAGRIETIFRGGELLFRLKYALHQTAENALSRFLSYHEGRFSSHTEQRRDYSKRSALYHWESGVIERLTEALPAGVIPSLSSEHETLRLSHKETLLPESGREHAALLTVLRELHDVRLTQNTESSFEDEIIRVESERILSDRFAEIERHMAVSRTTRQEPGQIVTQGGDAETVQAGDTLWIDETSVEGPELIHRTERDTSHTFGTATKETLSQMIDTHLSDTVREAAGEYISDTFESAQTRHTENRSFLEAGQVLEHAAFDREPVETVLREQLDQIDRRNRERIERVRSEIQPKKTEPEKQPRPDHKQVLRDALRAIEDPAAMLAEVMGEPVMEHRIPQPGAGLDALLSQTDETTKRIFEAVRQYERDPEEALKLGFLQPSEPSALNRESYTEHKESLLSLTHLTEAFENNPALRDIAGHPAAAGGTGAQTIGASRLREPEAITFVHKSTQNQNTEELRERLETQHRSTQSPVTETTRTVTENREIQTQVNQITQEIRAKTGEEINELVSKTLAKQIGFISERVYTQLEKRLQGERARRGRA